MAPVYEMIERSGPHTMRNGRTIKPGETVEVSHPREFGAGRDKFRLVSGEVDRPRDPRDFPVRVVGTTETGFSVINQVSGRKINTNPLPAEEAFALVGADVPDEFKTPAKAPDGEEASDGFVGPEGVERPERPAHPTPPQNAAARPAGPPRRG